MSKPSLAFMFIVTSLFIVMLTNIFVRFDSKFGVAHECNSKGYFYFIDAKYSCKKEPLNE